MPYAAILDPFKIDLFSKRGELIYSTIFQQANIFKAKEN